MLSILELITNCESGPFLFLNGYFRSPVADVIMWWASNRFIWIPLYAFFLWMIYKKYPKNFWMLIIACALLVLVNDQLANLFKSGVGRFRPTHDPVIGKLVMTVNNYRGGKFGFYSAHAANSFAVATFVSTLRNDAPKSIIVPAFSYALLQSFSRIYLGVHFPSDIAVGMTVGVFTGRLFAELYLKLYRYLLNSPKTGQKKSRS